MAAGRIYIADSRRMLEMQDECVHLVVTSPPYWQLKDYQTDGQIGFNDTYANYLKERISAEGRRCRTNEPVPQIEDRVSESCEQKGVVGGWIDGKRIWEDSTS